MKITLNLSPAPSTRDRYAMAWAVPATIIGVAVALLLYKATLGEFHEYQRMQAQVREVQARANDLHQQETSIRRKLDDPSYQGLLTQVNFVNKLIQERQLSLTALTTRLAGLLPQDSHITELSLTSPRKPSDSYMVRMGLTSKGEDSIETFLNDLEDSPDFKDISIINQGFQEQSSLGQQVNLVCTARYLPDVNPDETQPGQAVEDKPQRPSKQPNEEKRRAKEPAANRQPNH
jgi:hypothetical protein